MINPGSEDRESPAGMPSPTAGRFPVVVISRRPPGYLTDHERIDDDPIGRPVRIDNLSEHFGRRSVRVTALDDVSMDFPAALAAGVIGTVTILATATIMTTLPTMNRRRG